MKGYILIHAQPGANRKVAEQLEKLDEVIEAHMTFGPYDVVAVVRFDDLASMGDIIDQKIQPVPGVVDTLTCLATD
ncbi:MAG: Lrp/AsnC ligand binding domain-containing protein [Anaerolineales bacterium]